MTPWPVIGEPELLTRLAMPDEEFIAHISGWTRAIGRREFTEEIYARALGYPWPRPAQSYLLAGDVVAPLDGLEAPAREAVLAELAGAESGRHPLLAFGSNGSPETLALKFAHLPEPERRLVVLAGDLHDFDVGAAAGPTLYGSLPATIFPSAGTAVRASLLWVTTVQLVALTWTEISYRLGRLDGVGFAADEPRVPTVEHVYAFVSRWGAHCVDGDAVAMRAIPASGRSGPALTQEQLLDQIAAIAFGPAARARDLVMRVMDDFGAAAATIVPVLRATARPFRSERWTAYPAAQVAA